MIYQGDCLEVLKTIPDNSVDSCVTDPPYGLSREPDIVEVLTKWLDGEDYHHRGGGFMGKTWDSFVPGPSVWREVYRVLKPGAHLLCFAGTRTQDLMTISLRLARFEVRDVIEWLYFSGFPKSMDVSKAFDRRAGAEREVVGVRKSEGGRSGISNSVGGHLINYGKEIEITAPATDLAKKWDGWGTALKPAHEPIILARKPLDGTVADNVERWGTGALNIDGCRIPGEITTFPKVRRDAVTDRHQYGKYNGREETAGPHEKGRFPANCVTTEPDVFFSKYFNVTPPELSKKASKRDRNSDWLGREIVLREKPSFTEQVAEVRNKDWYSMSLYCVKCGKRKDAKCGCNAGFEQRKQPGLTKTTKNNHPTVKPTDLMAWLVRLITPPGGTVLDPFAGSGSTLVAAKREGFSYVGIEQEAEYVEIAKARVGE